MKKGIWLITVAGVSLSFLTSAQTGSSARGEPALLEPGKAVEHELDGGQRREYEFGLQAGQYAIVRVEQRNIDVALTCLGPNRRELFVVDSRPIGEIESAELIAYTPGDYRLHVSARDANAPAGRYKISLREPEAATEQHKARIAAARAFVQGMTSRRLGARDAMLSAVAFLEDALTHWRAARDSAEEANTLRIIALTQIDLGEQRKALDYAAQALVVARDAHDRRAEGRALSAIGAVHNYFGDKKKAIEYAESALPILRAEGDRAGEGETLSAVGVAYTHTGEKRKALKYFDDAARIFRDLQDRSMLADVINNAGLTYDSLGEYDVALREHLRALAIQRGVGDRGSEAVALNNIGTAYSGLAQFQKALAAYTAALDINRSLDQRWNAGINLNNIGWVYASIGDLERALPVYQEALAIFRAINDQRRVATALNNIAEIHADLGSYSKALELHNEALPLRRNSGYPDGEATTLTNLARSYARLGQREKARDHFLRALTILRTVENRRMLAGTLRNLGRLDRETGDYQRAFERLGEALEISRAIRDQSGVVAALGELARVEWDRGNLTATHQRAEEALVVLESLRLTIISPQLRASLFASAREVRELEIEALMRMHSERPGGRFGAAALFASEKGRARSLLELLGESSTEIHRGVDGALLDRERQVRQLISAKADRQTRLLSGTSSEREVGREAASIEEELGTLGAELEQIQSRIRETSPHFAELTQPVPLDVSEIQRKVLDDETTLLFYALGTERSFLWVVTPASLEAFELPPRAEIESIARRVYELLTARNQYPSKETPAARAARIQQADQQYFAAAAKASRMLLGPAASHIPNKRLLIVGEGVLQYLPFAALPEPGTDSAGTALPLMVNHEIVSAPSASVVAVLRQEIAGRKPAPNAVAILADPVFSGDDARVRKHRGDVQAVIAKQGAVAEAIRSAEAGVPNFVRLRFSRSEAEQIARLAPEGATMKALDFDASRDTVMSPEFGQYRIVHFATHGLLNNEHPDLSGIVLSLVSRDGHPQNGFLRLYEIYNLRLGADLVVLSACQTALGKEIKGEGLIGLTRGFLYAGAARVVASLWKVDDRATAELMKHFYEAMLGRGQAPAAALRTAQIASWKTNGREAPYYWAAFTIQGEWR